MSRFGNRRYIEPTRKYKGFHFRFEFTSYKIFWKSGEHMDTPRLRTLKETKDYITSLITTTEEPPND